MKQHWRLFLLSALFLAIWTGRQHVAKAVVSLSRIVPIQLPPELEAMHRDAQELKELHQTKRPPGESDWLSLYPENGQSFPEYVRDRKQQPVVREFSKVYVVPIGVLTTRQRDLVKLNSEFLHLYYGFSVEELPTIDITDIIPLHVVRKRENGTRQLDAHWINQQVLLPRRPEDAVAVIGLIAEDLWCHPVNFVFGLALPEDRVGVWSLFRLGNPDGNANEFRQCIWRTLQTSVHETGHILGFPHCTAYECCMNGSAHRDESDRQPLELCPECQAKVWWTCDMHPRDRWHELQLFAEVHGLNRESQTWLRHIQHWDHLKK